MSAFDDALTLYKEQVAELGLGISDELLTKVAKGLGPSIYNADSSKVSSADPEELVRVKNNFLIKKLGLTDGPELDEAIAYAVEKLGSSNRSKYRANFYALCVIKLGQEGFYA
jgi:Protein of unknown function (DUF2853)